MGRSLLLILLEMYSAKKPSSQGPKIPFTTNCNCRTAQRLGKCSLLTAWFLFFHCAIPIPELLFPLPIQNQPTKDKPLPAPLLSLTCPPSLCSLCSHRLYLCPYDLISVYTNLWLTKERKRYIPFDTLIVSSTVHVNHIVSISSVNGHIGWLYNLATEKSCCKGRQ